MSVPIPSRLRMWGVYDIVEVEIYARVCGPPAKLSAVNTPTASGSRAFHGRHMSDAAEVPKEEEAKPVRPAPRYSQPLASGAPTRPQTAAPHSGLAMAQAKPSPNASCTARLRLPVFA